MLARLSFLVAALSLATPVVAAPSQVHLGWRGPTDTTMTVTWRSAESTGEVSYGETTDYGSTVAAVSTPYGGSWLHEAQLTGLSAGTTYHYRAGAGASLAPDRTFTTGPTHSAGASFRFAAYGDSRTDDAARARVRAAVQARQPAFSIDSGDLVEDGTNQALWDQWFGTMEPLLATTPLQPVVGNHELSSPLFYRQFAMPRHAGSADVETYASWDYGNVHFLSLNSEIAYGPGSPQHLWLDADLAVARADPRVRWIVALFHRPPYSSGSHGSDTAIRAAWSPLFEKYGVNLVFSGHDHDYERTLPMAKDAVQADGNGVVYVVTGGAGAPLYPVGRSGFTAFARTTYHFVELDVTPTSLSLTAFDTGGNAIDTSTLANDTPLPGEGGVVPPIPPIDPVPPIDPAPGSGGGPPAASLAPSSGTGCETGSAGGSGALASLLALALLTARRVRRR